MTRAFAFALALVAATPSFAEEVGKIATDWTGNDIVVDAIQDPKVQGVTCHLTYFERGLIDRLRKGNWFQDPSNSSIACRQPVPSSWATSIPAARARRSSARASASSSSPWS
jgi:CreA protein